MAFQRTTMVALFASVATGMVVTLASGELRAERDVGLELLRANEQLIERIDRQDAELAELRARIDAGAGKPGGGTTAPGPAPQGKTESEMNDAAAFRKKALVALKPELEAIDARAETAKSAFDKHVQTFATHRHDFEVAAHGWVRLDGMLTEDGRDMLRPTYSDDWIAIRRTENGATPTESLTKTTTKPK